MASLNLCVEFDGGVGNVDVSAIPIGAFENFSFEHSDRKVFELDIDCIINLVGVSPNGGSTTMTLEIDGVAHADSPIVENTAGPFTKHFTISL